MMEKNLDDILGDAAKKIGIILNDRQLSLFSAYYRELLVWNQKINLVSIKSDLDIPVKHFIDSMTPLSFLENPSARLLDIGAGAGFPGIPMKIAVPSLKVFLLESSRKKTSFLKHTIRILGLDEITVIHNRIENMMFDDVYRNGFDTVISRATFKLPALISISSHFLIHNGILVAMKGNKVTNELEEAMKISEKAGLVLLACHDRRLPVTGDPRKIIIFKKTVISSDSLK
jgi:16S rRNA (guanine527-N7)-methyltransferase